MYEAKIKSAKDAFDAADAKAEAKAAKSAASGGTPKKVVKSPAAKGTKICTSLFSNGVVPDQEDIETKYKGYKYFCSKSDHIDPENPKGNTINPAADGAASLVVTAISVAAISVYLYA